MDEEIFISALLDSRNAYERVRGRIALSDFSDFGRLVVKEAVRYYQNDQHAQFVDRAVLRAALGSAFPNPKQSAAVQDFLGAIPRAESSTNAADLYLRVRRRNKGLEIADIILKGGDNGKLEEVVADWIRLGEDALPDQFKERLTYEDLYEKGNDQGKLPVYPAKLNEVLRGGVRRGHNILIVGRPGAAKTLVTVNLVAGMAHAGHRVLYIANEENTAEIQRRFISRLGGVSLWDLNQEDTRKEAAAYKKGEQRALKRGYQNVIVTDEFRTTQDLEGAVGRLKPDVLVLDQIRHVNERMDLLQRQEAVTRWLRDTAHTNNLVAIGTAQVGKSGENKAIIGLTDIDFSNTGVQGACDLIMGIGLTEDMKRQHKRMICIPRNKISGIEKNFPVWLDELHTKVRSKP